MQGNALCPSFTDDGVKQERDKKTYLSIMCEIKLDRKCLVTQT